MKKVLVVSHERSGTHLLINTIALNFGYDADDISLHDTHGDLDCLHRQYLEYQMQHERRIFKSHHVFPCLRDIWKCLTANWDIFYLARDPLDVMVSAWKYHQEAGVDAFPVCDSLSDWLRIRPGAYPFDRLYTPKGLRSENMPQRWAIHVWSWWRVHGIHYVTYEQLMQAFEPTVAAIGMALGITAPEHPVRPEIGKHKSVCPRKGIVGDWKNHMTPDDRAFCQAEIEKVFGRKGQHHNI